MTGETLADCVSCDFSAGRIGGRDAMIQAVLSIAAVGVGMLLLVLALVVATAGLPG